MVLSHEQNLLMSKSYLSLAMFLVALGGLLFVLPRVQGASYTFTLRIANLNTHLLPRVGEGFASNRGQSEYRAGKIGRWSTNYDLVGLCEVFDDVHRKTLLEAAQSAPSGTFEVLWTPKPPSAYFANSGLLLLSRFPIVAHHAITYAHASQFLTHGFRADAFAAKGALHARIHVCRRPLLLVDCFLTHLESRSGAIRARQLEDLARFIAEHGSPDRAAILLGDLNVPADPPKGPSHANTEYRRLLAALRTSGLPWGDVWPGAGHGPAGTSDPLVENGGERIDYIFVSPLGYARSSPWQPIRAHVSRLLDDKVHEGSLSDHAAVVCDVRLTRER
jgi:endonuclease/exonuclease/phosphatase family metal-dependent hydrolase